jgi:DNA-binding MarR family transcriptional regulator
MAISPNECAREILEAIPLTMRAIRAQMRGNPANLLVNLSEAQFRTLMFLQRHEGASLSEVAAHLGLTLPSMSKQMDSLVARGVVARRTDPNDRRRVILTLTVQGRGTLASVREVAQAHLAEMLAVLTPSRRATIVEAMRALRQVFSAVRPSHGEQAGRAFGHVSALRTSAREKVGVGG